MSNLNNHFLFFLDGGNPPVVMDEDAIGRDSEIVVVNLPDKASNFETIDPVKAPNLMEVPTSASIRLKVDISDDSNSGCGNIFTNTTEYQKVLGKYLIILFHYY